MRSSCRGELYPASFFPGRGCITSTPPEQEPRRFQPDGENHRGTGPLLLCQGGFGNCEEVSCSSLGSSAPLRAHGRLAIYDDARHLPPEECPVQLASDLRQFIQDSTP